MQRVRPITFGILLFIFLVGVFSWLWMSSQFDTTSKKFSLSAPTIEADEWRSKLTPAEYHILREKGTEQPFSSPLNNEKRKGVYVTADTGEPVFRSEDKYDSGTGWPSFTQPIASDAILTATDNGLFTERTEVLSKAGGHLGHVFTDGPPPTGLRYCMNGTALKFIPDKNEFP